MSDIGLTPGILAAIVGVYVVAPAALGAGGGAAVGMLLKRQSPVKGALIGAGVGLAASGATAAIIRTRLNAKESERLAVLRKKNAEAATQIGETARRQRWVRRADFLACVMQNDAARGVPGAQSSADQMKVRAQAMRDGTMSVPAGEPPNWTGAQPPWCGAPQ